MKVRPLGTKLFHADGQTDVTKLRVAICDFANAPKNGLLECDSVQLDKCRDMYFHNLCRVKMTSNSPSESLVPIHQVTRLHLSYDKEETDNLYFPHNDSRATK